MILKDCALDVFLVHIYLMECAVGARWVVVYNARMIYVHNLSLTKISAQFSVVYGFLALVSHVMTDVRHVV